MTENNTNFKPWLNEWPSSGLEEVSCCPACKNPSRTLIYSRLVDGAFLAAPGHWKMWRCDACGSGYLNPRPDPETISNAYSNYYTHDQNDTTKSSLKMNVSQKLKLAILNGFREARYGRKEDTSWPTLGKFLGLSSKLCTIFDLQQRHLPRNPEGEGRLLDVGCGNGSYLEIAKKCGWHVTGVDFDQNAVVSARSRGLNVLEGDIFKFDPQEHEFERITISHVIEHLYNPAETLKRAADLLSASGLIWIETPNFNAPTHRKYGAAWRGLEAPRHLCILTKFALQQLCESAGLIIVDTPKWPDPSKSLINASLRQPIDGSPDPLSSLFGEASEPEFLTFFAKKA